MTIATLTAAAIETLSAESASQGDARMVGVCRAALTGSYRSRCAVVSALRAGRG